MAKICLITDTHFGGRNDSQIYDDFFRDFYQRCFFPRLKNAGITHIIHLGDIFDRRKYINFASLQRCKEYFFDQLQMHNMEMDLIVGNHDVFYRNTNRVNSPELLLREYKNIHIHTQPTVKEFGGTPILMMPWINTENLSQSMNALSRSQARVCLGHFDIAGFAMHAGDDGSKDGLSPELFAQFDLVCSGHFHHKSTSGNITYLGNPYEMTWSDWNDPRGFHLLDTDTLQLEFIRNPFTIFEKLYYDDSERDYSIDFGGVDLSDYQGKNVKLIVTKKKDYFAFEKFVTKLEEQGLVDLKIIEDMSEFETEVNDEAVSLENTAQLLSTYVGSLETSLDKERIQRQLQFLYTEAQRMLMD